MTFRGGILPLLAVLLVAGCSGSEPAKVQLARVTRAPVSEVVEAPATVGARATAALTAPASGTVAKLYVQDGDTVEKGQILAKISSPQAKDQLDQARKADRQASRPVSLGGGATSVRLPPLKLPGSPDVARCFAQARRAAKKIKDPAIRAQLLSAVDTAEAQQRAQQRALSQIVTGLNQSISQVTGRLGAGLSGLTASMSSLQAASRSQARVAVKAAQRTVDGLVVKAPFGGVVTLGGPSSGGGTAGLSGLLSQLPAGLAGQAGAAAAAPSGRSGGVIATGVPVAAGDTIATVTDVSTLTLSADVDETDVLLVKEGTPAHVELDAVTGATYAATVTGIGVTPKEGATGGVSYPVRLRLGKGVYDDQSAAPWPKPGMSAVVRLTVRESPDATAVPASAIVTSGRETIVWAVRGGRAERRVVKLGAQGDAAVEVLSGVSPGEQVVVKGADTVRQAQPLP
ncbi:efflux RND transporter periplasmic adaptor subunit [Planotetraspora sp. A-T 1434]|uniref:efflux RND transporter periplasmic adaptor subunit n=1 Tax=Planotetraspora sp. A-T 1434 TaxID=2979219 RepID=UPI0021C193B6|nr:efflux RND transporter periplasmic adaptor subunit [Planotetraspora sp. A-T 1434]MCT9932088.1 efflux RND transporter periplasmic adaptor subunit [Planotetraspora sp. A-T 1434]